MKLHRFLPVPVCVCFASPSCSQGDLVFAARSSIGLEVAGDVSKLPDHVNFGYRRREFLYAGDKAPKNESALAKMDVETTWFDGMALRETFATGTAAEKMVGKPGGSPAENSGTQPVVFGSHTRIGLAMTLPSAGAAESPSLLAGFSRRVATIVRSTDGEKLPSVAATMQLHTSGINPKGSAPSASLPEPAKLSDQGATTAANARVRQFFAVGKAADELDKQTQQKILAATTGNPLETKEEAKPEPQDNSENPTKGGTQKKDVIYLAFPGTGNQKPRPLGEIESIANQAFDAWGGLDRLALLLSAIRA
ncbi:MAG: hypothetical protein J0M04_16935 [Verrucomicrobia bacterium]|nr:hypothetical protein [Verrucomicrobiota bacterium]